MKEKNLEILVAESYLLGETKDFTTILTKMKDAGVEAIFCVSDETELPMILQQAHGLDYDPFFTSTGTYSQVVIDLGGEDVEGLYGQMIFDQNDVPEKVEAFMAKYKERFETDVVTTPAMTAYMATQMVIEGIRENGATRDGIQQFLAGMTDFETMVGPLSFDENGDARIPLTRCQIKDGTFAPAE